MEQKRDAEATAAAILAAARQLFAVRGYDIGVREIARGAGCDPSLVNRYFGGKEGLFEAVMESFDVSEAPARDRSVVDALVARVLAKGDADLALEVLLKSASNPTAGPIVRRLVQERFLDPLAATLGDDATSEARAGLAAALVLGLAIGRSVLTLPGLRDDAALEPHLRRMLSALLEAAPAEDHRPPSAG